MEKPALTSDEARAIAALERLAVTWPKSLWLFSASGSLCVMKKKNGKRAMTPTGGFDNDYQVGSPIKIDNDGGGW